MKWLVLNGPNINQTGTRETNVYGILPYEEMMESIVAYGKEQNQEIICRQSNHEGQLIDWIQNAVEEGFKGIVMNPGAFTHYSYALYDVIKGSRLPFVEIHMSNIYAREAFRQKSVTASACKGQISGFGIDSYFLGLQGLWMNR